MQEIPPKPTVTIDASGLSCPEPLMLLRNAIRTHEGGTVFVLISEDPVSLRDVPAFCSFMGHTLLSLPDDNHPHRYVICSKIKSQSGSL